MESTFYPMRMDRRRPHIRHAMPSPSLFLFCATEYVYMWVYISMYVCEMQRLTIFQSLKTFLSAPPKQIYAQVDRRKENCNEKARVKSVFAFRFLSSFFNVVVWKSIIYLSCISSNTNITWHILMHPKIRIFLHWIKFKDHV